MSLDLLQIISAILFSIVAAVIILHAAYGLVRAIISWMFEKKEGLD